MTREDVNKRVLKTLSFFDKVHIVAPPVTNNNILASIYKNSQDQNLNKDESHTPSISSEISTEKQLDDVKIMPDLNTEWVQMGLDSLDVVEVMIALEEEFHMEIPDAVADSAKTPKEIAKYIYDFIYPRESETSSSPLEEPLVDSESEFKQ